MEILIIIILVVNFIISLIVGDFGSKREIGYWGGFFTSFFLTPILAMLFVIASPIIEIKKEVKEVDETIIKNKKKPDISGVIVLFILILFAIIIWSDIWK